MPALPPIAVLMGGPDAERDVSVMSGREIAAALRQSGRFDVHDLVIDAPSADQLRTMLPPSVSAVFPIVHGRWGEGGPLQQTLEELSVPYVGSRPKAAFLAMDKLATKTLVATENIPSPRSRELIAGEACDIEPPLVIKPVDDGSSVDLRICRTPAEVEAARAELHPKRPRLMAESYIRGREITAGLLFGKPLPLIEILPAVEFYDYQAKYFRDDTRYVVNPELPPSLDAQIKDLSRRSFELLGCRDVARVDFMVDARGPWFLEINTAPGFTTHSLVPMAARAMGLEMPELCANLVAAAIERGPAAARPTVRASSFSASGV